MGLATSSKYYIIRSAKRRAEKIVNLPLDKTLAACRELYEFCAVKSRSPVLAKEKTDILFVINRIESANFALQEGNISAKKHKRQTAEAIDRLLDSIERMKIRERQLKAKAIGAGEDYVVDKDEEVVSASKNVKTRKITGLEGLQEAFKAQQAEIDTADKVKKAALQSQGYFDDETLAQKSVSVIQSFEKEKDLVQRKFSSVSDQTNRLIFTASIMVRVESPLPNEVKYSKQRVHSIGSGFFIFERQTLVAYREKYDGKALVDLRPMKEDYFFNEPSLPFHEIRWFVSADVYKFMRGVRFSVLAFPWSAKYSKEEPKVEVKSTGLPPAETRRLVESLVESHPSIVSAKSKIAALTKESIDIERKVTVRQSEKIKIQSQIDSLKSKRDSLSAIHRVALDKQVRGLEEKLTPIIAEIAELSARSKQLRSGVAQLTKTSTTIRERTNEKYLRVARLMIASGKPYTQDTFLAGMMKRIEKSQETASS